MSMDTILRFPFVIFLGTLTLMWLALRFGVVLKKWRPTPDDERDDLNLLTSSTLTLLALIIGFSFSMAVGRYDQRKNYEEEEANAIGTEYVRAALLPAGQAAQVQKLLVAYLDERIVWYTEGYSDSLAPVDARTASLQNDMWSIVQQAATAQPTPVNALVLAGMNDVLNRQGYTQAAFWNRIPAGAWILMIALAICCCALIAYGAKRKGGFLFAILPVIVGVAFFLIADLDSPRRGAIRVHPQNLIALQQSLPKP